MRAVTSGDTLRNNRYVSGLKISILKALHLAAVINNGIHGDEDEDAAKKIEPNVFHELIPMTVNIAVDRPDYEWNAKHHQKTDSHSHPVAVRLLHPRHRPLDLAVR